MEKNIAIKKVDEIVSKVNSQQADYDQRTENLEKGAKLLNEISKSVKEFDLATLNADVHRDRFLKKIDNAPYLTEERREEMERDQ